GCVNVHASLLPKLRGASPIQHAILQGEEETGITIMQMNEGLDTGDMLAKDSLKIGDMNGEELHDALSSMGAELLIKTLPLIEEGKITPQKQDDSLSTYAGLISKQDGKIDFTKTPSEIERQIRAFDPWPGAFCGYGDGQMKIWKAEPVSADAGGRSPGEILSAEDTGLDVVCGDGVLRITEIQMPGKKRVAVKDYLRGNRFDKDIK
ncbi:MAG: methionyl-tRNA formyltransferase, partial [Emergencia sp.]|nr:methionyl-tRNA formyltransferase [Emergencia sp.]